MKAIILVLALLLITSVSATELSCQDAILSGDLSATITENSVDIHNPNGYQVSVASYEMYAALIEDQVLFDSKTATETSIVTIDTPTCNNQIVVVCGEPLPYNPLYDGLVVAHQINTDNHYCQPTTRQNNATVELTIKDDYPKSTSYIFECNADNFIPTSYYWYYGDGELLPSSEHNNTYHTYENGGNYTVACTATDGNTWQTVTKQIEVVEPTVALKIAPWYPKENHYVFMCEAQGFTPTAYDFEFQDGEKLYDQTVGDVYHIFEQNGDFQVTCAASDDERYISANIDVTIDSCNEYSLAIEQATRTDNGVVVKGTLTSNTPVSGENITVNGQQTGVLLNEWSIIVNDTENVTATFTNNCNQEYTVTATPKNMPTQIQTINTNQPLQINNNGGGNACWPGFEKVAGKCVHESEPLLAMQEQSEPTQTPTQKLPEPTTIEQQHYKGETFEPIKNEQQDSFAWIIVAIGLMALAAGLFIR